MRYVYERTFQALTTVLAVVTISFVLIRQLPGGPADYLRASLQKQGVSNSEIQSLVEQYTNVQPNAPIWQQYLDYVVAVIQGDLGQSVWYQEPVTDILLRALPWTVFVMASAITLTFLIGVALGAVMAYRQNSWFDRVSTGVSIFLFSVPYYLLGVLLIYFLAIYLGWFPASGRTTSGTVAGLNWPFVSGVLYHAALPIASLVITGIGGKAVTMRANSISVLGEDFVRVANLRGLSERRIAFRYVGRNAIMPMYTGLAISIGYMFGGSIILEQIFSYPGVGYYMFDAINARDYPLMMGAFLLIVIGVTLGVYVADLTYGMIDPRAGMEGAE